MEEKFEVREENREQKIICASGLSDFEKLEVRKDKLESKIEDVKKELKIKSMEVQQLRTKIHQMIDNMTNMAAKATNHSQVTSKKFEKLNLLTERLVEHNLK